jgi:hypothetical protein
VLWQGGSAKLPPPVFPPPKPPACEPVKLLDWLACWGAARCGPARSGRALAGWRALDGRDPLLRRRSLRLGRHDFLRCDCERKNADSQQ